MNDNHPPQISKEGKDYTNKPLNREDNAKLILTLLAVFVILLALILLLYFVQKRTSIFGRAYSGSQTNTVELANSYIFASPLKAKANGVEKMRVTVFVLDSRGSGVIGRKVTLGTTIGMDTDIVQSITDDLGKAVFDISSVKPGLFIIEAQVDGQAIPQKVNVHFD